MPRPKQIPDAWLINSPTLGFKQTSEDLVYEFGQSLASTEWTAPEYKLMAHLLADAVYSYRQQVGVYGGASQTHPGVLKQRLSDEARRWFISDDDDYVFSFVSICQTLGISANWFRVQVLGRDWKRANKMEAA